MTMDLIAHLTRQAAVSRAIFGPGARTKGVSDHIRKELKEIEACHDEDDRALEWVDVAILGLDGLLRSLWARRPNDSAPMIAQAAAYEIEKKQSRNEMRNWPDWRTAPEDKAIEHVRTEGEAAAKAQEFDSHFFNISEEWNTTLYEIAKSCGFTESGQYAISFSLTPDGRVVRLKTL